jgi:hypothetical protein
MSERLERLELLTVDGWKVDVSENCAGQMCMEDFGRRQHPLDAASEARLLAWLTAREAKREEVFDE